MLGKLKSMVTALRRDMLDFLPIKALMLGIEGNGAADPTIDTEYNILSVTRTSVGVYNVTPTQTTVYGVDIFTNATHSVGFVIAPNATSESHFVNIENGAGSTFDIIVTEMTVGVGNKLELNPYDLVAGDIVNVTVLMNLGLGRLPPE